MKDDNNNIEYTILHNSTTNNDPTNPMNVADIHMDYTASLQMGIDNAICKFLILIREYLTRNSGS